MTPARGPAGRAAAAAMAAYVGAVALIGLLGADVRPLASSPAGVGRGQLVQLLSSGLPVSGPWLPPALLLAGAGMLAARAAGPTRAAATGLLAHVAGTLIPYAALALVRVHSPHAWQAEWNAPDFGVSLVFGSWLALTAVRDRNRTSGIALGLLALALARPGESLAGAEHACALLIGAACGLKGPAPRRPTSRVRALQSR